MLLLVVGVTLVSCNSDDDDNGPIIPGPPTGSEITYKVNVPVDMIQQIKYKTGTGAMFFGDLTPDSRLSWYKIIVVPFANMPLDAFIEGKFRNTSDAPQTYTLEIYKDNVLVKTSSGTVPMIDDNDETDDIVTGSTHVMIQE